MLKPVRDIFGKREDSGKVLYSCKQLTNFTEDGVYFSPHVFGHIDYSL